jgi:DnaJ-domain-containing protein 1
MASLGRRLLDLARANLNALLEKAAGDTSVDELTDEELEAELERRRHLRQREEAERKSREAAEQAARERYTQRTGQPPPPKRESRQRRQPPPRVPPPSSERRLRDLYAQLEVPYGSEFEEVKKSFRRLMRKYHPDLHTGNPEKQKVATQLTMSLTQAYNELEQHLVGGPNRGS